MKKIALLTVVLWQLMIMLGGCKKIIEIDTPQYQLITKTVFADSTTATAALLNIYALYPNTIDASFNPYMALYADELKFSNTTIQQTEYVNSFVSPTNTSNLNLWKSFYYIIYSCNDLLDQLKSTKNLTPSLIRQLTAEAKFLRAFAYFNLIQVYGNVPLILKTAQDENAAAPNSSKAQIFSQILADLTDAQGAITETYPGTGKARANKLAVTALLSKTYLYLEQWDKAEIAASMILDPGPYPLVPSPDGVFIANSTETILEFEAQNGFTVTGPIYIPRTGRPQYYFSTNLIAAFESGDKRITSWTKAVTVSGVKYTYPYKYHNRALNLTAAENLIAFRSAEQYLIRAEARARLGKIQDAQNDLNMIRKRAGVPLNTDQTADKLINAIFHERQVELFAEWANRFFDLKRSNSADFVLGAFKPTWKSGTSLLLPIPQNELIRNFNLKQNPGY